MLQPPAWSSVRLRRFSHQGDGPQGRSYSGYNSLFTPLGGARQRRAPDDRASRQRYLRSTMLRDSARHRLRPRAVRLKLSEMFFRPTTKSL